MWRHVTRGLQQNFKRSICLENPDSCGKDGHNSNHPRSPNGCALMRAIQSLNRCDIKDGNDQGQKNYYGKTTRNISQHTFFEAFGWSGALVFGWAISKQFWFTHISNKDEELSGNGRTIKLKSLIEIVSHVVRTQPPIRNVLPQLNTTQDKSVKDEEDEFEAAAQELKEIHERTIGEALNRRGIACLSKSTGAEAIQYFKRASELKYPPASFNMGQCCELGIGTKQDFKEAAEWYTKASEQGHATAMYNLGVFYAHGWGGLQSDIITAKELFVKAAKLGQSDARAALDKEYKAEFKINLDTTDSQSPFMNDNVVKALHSRRLPNLNIFVNKIRTGLNEDAFQKEFGSDKKWDVPFNSAVAF